MRLCVWSRNLVNEEAVALWGGGGLSQKKKDDKIKIFLLKKNFEFWAQ